MSYIQDDFLLSNKTGQYLYKQFAKDAPIFDYHCHLSEYQIYENKPFENIYEIWLKYDHYKWRLMRNYGIDEKYITGDASEKEKFCIFCKVLETAFGNPLYHWCQLELEQYFDCTLEINEKNVEKIWEHCNKIIKDKKMTPCYLIESSKVKTIFTTNEIFDDLAIFEKLKRKNLSFDVFPAFRADKIMNIEAEKYLEYISKLGKISRFEDLLLAIEKRLLEFIKVGCVASDTALERVYLIPTLEEAKSIFERRIKGESLSVEEVEKFKGYLTWFLLKIYGQYNIKSELHIGAMRNNNSIALSTLGLDSGYDSIASPGDSIKNLSLLLDRLNNENSLPPMIIFNLNPSMNVEITTLIGCFQGPSYKGKIQHGAAWWFLDNIDGIKEQLRNLSLTGHIATFVGMLTDSRSFLSYSRHLYFRRILCNYFGEMVEKGEITKDLSLIGKVVLDICYNNTVNYFMGK